MPVLRPNESPPDGYYASNVKAVVETGCKQYDDLLVPEERRCANAVLALSQSGIRMFARLISRTKNLIRVDSLNYVEIEDEQAALEELSSKQLISINDMVEPSELLGLLTVPELRSTFPECDDKRSRKQELMDAVIERFGVETVFQRVSVSYSWVNVEVAATFDLFCLLFFGNAMQRLDEFVIRDLGISRFEDYELNPEFRLFQSRRDIERYLELNALAEVVHELGKDVEVEDADAILTMLKNREDDRVFELRRSRILNALARNLERADELECALHCYSFSTVHPARERTMRVLKRLDRDTQVEELRTTILNDPLCHEERQFAERFKRPKHVRIALPDRESPAPTCSEQTIEAYAVEQLNASDDKAWHLENLLPMGLFALAYWNWLYAPVRGAFVNPFQSAPLDLYWPEFFKVRQDLCEDPLAKPLGLKSRMLATAKAKRGITNQLISWQAFDPEMTAFIIDAFTVEQLCDLLRIIIEDLRQFRAGFPDLTVIDKRGHIGFIEVKGPGDQLRPNQRLWIERLMAANFPVHVWRFK